MGLFEDMVDWMRSPKRTQQMQGVGNWLSDYPKRFQDNLNMQQGAADYAGNRVLNQPVTPEQQASYDKFVDEAAGGMPVAGMIVGRGIAPEMIERAKQMMNIGASPGRILQETGLVRVPTKDGYTWGRQISDLPSKVDFEKLDSQAKWYNIPNFKKETLLLKDVVDHPELFKLYPELENINVTKMPYSGSGFYSNVSNTLGVSPPPVGTKAKGFGEEYLRNATKEAHSVMLHEIQHAIQGIENWARGGSPKEFTKAGTVQAEAQVKWAEKSIADLISTSVPSKGFVNVERIMKKLDDYKTKGEEALKFEDENIKNQVKSLASSNKLSELEAVWGRIQRVKDKINDRRKEAHGKYEALAGEAQSRAVQSQWKTATEPNTGEQAYKFPVDIYYDIPTENLIFRDPFAPTIK